MSKMDPLAKLFSGAQLTGLSDPKKKNPSNIKPLDVNFEEMDAPRSVKLKRPPRLDGYEVQPQEDQNLEIEGLDEDSDEEIVEEQEENTLEDQPRENPLESAETVETAEHVEPSEPEMSVGEIQMLLLKKKMEMERARLKMTQEQSNSTSNQSSGQQAFGRSVAQPIQSNMAERLAKATQNNESKSAMDIFLELSQPSQPSLSKSTKSVTATASQPVVPSEATQKNTEPVRKKRNLPNVSSVMGNRLILDVQAMIQERLPNLKEFHVVSAMDSFDRVILQAMWKMNQSKFLMTGKLEYAVAATAVIDALDKIPDGQLVAAYVETTASDYLIWIDLSEHRLLAAFADAGAYFA